MTRSVWRIAQDTKDYEAHDLSGKGAEITGGRWNFKGLPLVYASLNRALAGLETIVHLNAGGLPLNRYLIEIQIPQNIWERAQVITGNSAPVDWDAEPASKTSADFGSAWIRANSSLLLIVPSVIVPEKQNILINPKHADISSITARKLRKWLYDPRLTMINAS